ncbi:CD209 antigen-like protein E [Thalassophryne amazonica]|uniref:CD209 antigen-like protein E n=1 Tax=Thalassophryne amazonica TaxID=390379 RepID=UPI0014710999|nr:CD209 antigen-like protein E [Thalassophryne amazonica]
MENSQSGHQHKAINGHQHAQHQTVGKGGSVFIYHRLVLLGLILLNAVLLIVTVVLGICCAKAKDDDLQIPQSADTTLMIELSYLSNHSEVIKAKEEAQTRLEMERTSHRQRQVQLEQQKTLNDDLQKQIETLQKEKTILQYNHTTLEESCGKCQPGWILVNSSCYFFSNPASNPKRNWPNSRADCISRGADLVVIDNWEEQQLLNDNYKTDSTSKTWWENGYWIGLTDIETEEKWVWINNVTQVETYWIPGEPNNHGPDGEDCGAFYFSGDPMKTRYDGKCQYHLYNWLCEIKLK